MKITTEDLDNGNPSSVHPVQQGFEEARKAYEKAGEEFGSGVADRIRSGHEWQGEGVKEATTVMETNAIALAATRGINESAWLILDALGYALESAQKKYNKISSEATSYYLRIHKDGSASFESPQDRGVPNGQVTGGSVAEQQRIASKHQGEIERKAKGCLAFVDIADKGCSTQLAALEELSPTTTATASAKALAASREALTGALAAREIASLTQQFWKDAKPKAAPETWTGEDSEKVVGDVIGVGSSAAGVVGGLLASKTGLGALLGIPAAAASAKGVKDGIEKLKKDVEAAGDEEIHYTPPPGADAEDLAQAYDDSEGIVDNEDAQGFSPEGDVPGAPTDDDDLYKQYDGIGKRSDSEEELIYNEDTGEVYYSDDGGESYVKLDAGK